MRSHLEDLIEDHGATLVGGGALAAAVAVAVLLLVARASDKPLQLDPKTKCTASLPAHSTLVLVDGSHPLAAHNERRVRTMIRDWGHTARGSRIVIARMSGAADRRIEVLFDMCSPGRAEDADTMHEGRGTLDALWRKHYEGPLDDAINALGPVEIHRELMTAAQRLIMASKL